MGLVAVWAMNAIYRPTLCLFVCCVFWVHQQGSQGVDRFVVHCHVIGLESSCQLFWQHTNVGQTYGMLSSVSFSDVDLLFMSPWLHGVDNPRFSSCSFSGPFWRVPPLWSYPPLISTFLLFVRVSSPQNFCVLMGGKMCTGFHKMLISSDQWV